MPGFTSSAAELRELAKKWRAGQRAFNDLFDVLPKEENRVYSEVRFRESPDPYHKSAFEDCNQQWCVQEVRRLTAGDRSALRLARQAEKSKEELRTMRKRLTGKQSMLQKQLTERDGLLSGINDAKKASDAAKAKAYLVLCLGEYISTFPREETKERAWQAS